MSKRIAIIGAGPSGLACAKAVTDYGMQPTIFEAASELGGLWRPNGGYTWQEMRTNVSRWNNCFSDYPWAEDADDFPTSEAVLDYLNGYADDFALKDNLLLGTRVTSLRRERDKWYVSTSEKEIQHDPFAGVIVASGIFAKPDAPFELCKNAIHSSAYRRSPDWQGKRVAVIGGSFTGIEIAADLAGHGAEVLLFMTRPLWILPRYVHKWGRDIPLDLVTNMRRPAVSNLEKAHYLNDTFGNPGDVHEGLRVPIDNSPAYVAISDRFLEYVQGGAINVIRSRVEKIMPTRLKADNGEIYRIDNIVACTGYETELRFLSGPAQRLLNYNPADKLLPLVADHAVRPAQIPNLYFAGMYRGPYFGVMELQARWIAAMLANECPAATIQQIAAEAAIRTQQPPPQFPHGNYVEFSDDLAAKIGAIPQPVGDPVIDRAIAEGPVTPAHWRLSGPHAKPALARAAIHSAVARAAP